MIGFWIALLVIAVGVTSKKKKNSTSLNGFQKQDKAVLGS